MKPIIIWGKSDSLLAALTDEAKQELTELLIQAYEQGKTDGRGEVYGKPQTYYRPQLSGTDSTHVNPREYWTSILCESSSKKE